MIKRVGFLVLINIVIIAINLFFITEISDDEPFVSKLEQKDVYDNYVEAIQYGNLLVYTDYLGESVPQSEVILIPKTMTLNVTIGKRISKDQVMGYDGIGNKVLASHNSIITHIEYSAFNYSVTLLITDNQRLIFSSNNYYLLDQKVQIIAQGQYFSGNIDDRYFDQGRYHYHVTVIDANYPLIGKSNIVRVIHETYQNVYYIHEKYIPYVQDNQALLYVYNPNNSDKPLSIKVINVRKINTDFYLIISDNVEKYERIFYVH